MASITLQDLTRVYPPAVPALTDCTFEVADGSFVVLLGPSGCGKSTALRLVAGLELPDRGRVLIGRRDVTTTPPGDRNLAMVFQNYALYPHLTVRENLAFPLRMRRVPAVDRGPRIRRVAELLGLADLLERHPAQLSGGQRQRVALGRALVREPEAFLLDRTIEKLAFVHLLFKLDARHPHDAEPSMNQSEILKERTAEPNVLVLLECELWGQPHQQR